MSDASRRTARTAAQITVGAAAGLPLLVHTAGIPETLPGLGIILAVAAGFTRLMALPLVESWLPEWLRAAPARAALPSLTPLDPTPAAAADTPPEGR